MYEDIILVIGQIPDRKAISATIKTYSCSYRDRTDAEMMYNGIKH